MVQLLTTSKCCFSIIRPAAVLMVAQPSRPCCKYLRVPCFAVAALAIAMTAAGLPSLAAGQKTSSHSVLAPEHA